MRFNKVIYIRYFPLTYKIYADFYMKEATDIGLDVEYWDLTNIFFKSEHDMEDSSHLCKTKKLNSYKEVDKQINEIKNISSTLFISIMTFEPRISRLYQILTKNNCILSVFGRNMFPVAENVLKKQKLIRKIKKVKFISLINYYKSKRFNIKIKKGKIKKYDIVFMGGTLGWKGIGRISEKDIESSEIVKVNSDDYDTYLKLKKNVPSILEDYILFLDEYLPLHPDVKLFKIKNVKPENYYPELCRYFDRIEKQFSMPVIIAAHPKAIRYKTEDFFEGRKVVFGKTVNLTEHSNFVLAHDSTSINFPVVFGKKIQFISSKNIMEGIISVHENVVSFSNYLGCNYQWFDEEAGRVELIDEINILKYDNYKYNYQTWKETENMMTSKIFINFLK